MKKVDAFVDENKETQKNQQTTFTVQSLALKRQLAREIAAKYRDSDNLYTEFKKESDKFIVKKWAKRSNNTGKDGSSQKAQEETKEQSTPASTQDTLIPVEEESKVEPSLEERMND